MNFLETTRQYTQPVLSQEVTCDSSLICTAKMPLVAKLYGALPNLGPILIRLAKVEPRMVIQIRLDL